MKKLLGIIIIGLIFVGNAYSDDIYSQDNRKKSEIKKDIKDPFEGMSPEEIEKLMEKIQ